MNVKETKTKVKDWCVEHKDALLYCGCLVSGSIIGVCFGRAVGNVIANGYDRVYKMAIQDGYDQGRSDAIAIMLRDNNNPEVVAALAEHMAKYCKER